MDASANNPAALIVATSTLQASPAPAQTTVKASESSGDEKSFSSTINEVQDSAAQAPDRSSRPDRSPDHAKEPTDKAADTDSAARATGDSSDTAQTSDADTQTAAAGQTSPDSGKELPEDGSPSATLPADTDTATDMLLSNDAGDETADAPVTAVASTPADQVTPDGTDDDSSLTDPASAVTDARALARDATGPDADHTTELASEATAVTPIPVPDAVARVTNPDNRTNGSAPATAASSSGLQPLRPIQLSLDASQNGSMTQSGDQSTASDDQQAALLRELASSDSSPTNIRGQAGSDSAATAIAASSSTTSPFADTLRDLGLPAGQRPLQPLGNTDAFARGLSEQISVMNNDGVQAARIKLHPEHLGPLEIRVQIKDDTAQVWFHAQHGQTRDALEQAMPRLRELFTDQGMQLLQSDVSGGQGQAQQS
ncbi:MAG TPA: hypothetical protein ENK16_00105, partial [Chromatiales bacterium]|nr:hypothetical protein [Chromatiales bacterium]